MPMSCAYLYCKNSEKNCTAESGQKLSFFRFPKSASIRELWVKNLGQEGFEPKSRSVLCSRHFKKSCFCPQTDKSCRSRIRNNAVPTLFMKDGVLREISDNEDEDDHESNDGHESWDGWHSWPDKEDENEQTDEENEQTEEEQKKEIAKGLKELEDLMDEENEDDEDDEEMETVDDEGGGDDDGSVIEMGCPEGQESVTEKAPDILEACDKLTLDNVTMDSSLRTVQVGQQRMISMTFQDILNSLISSQSQNSTSPSQNAPSSSTNEDDDHLCEDPCRSGTMTVKQVLQQMTGNSTRHTNTLQKSKATRKSNATKPSQSNTTGTVSHSPESMRKEAAYENITGRDSSSAFEGDNGQNMNSKWEDSPEQNMTTPAKIIPAHLSSKLADLKAKKAARSRSQKSKMVLSIYREDSMMRIVSSEDLPYVCGNCGLAFTHADLLKEHVGKEHGYVEPDEVKKNGEITSQVVIHREFTKENLRSKAKVKELRKKYREREPHMGNRSANLEHEETQGHCTEKVHVNESAVPLLDSDDDSPAPIDDDDGESDARLSDGPETSKNLEANWKPEATKKSWRSNGYQKRCHRCGQFFSSIFKCNIHMAKEHGEYTSQAAAEASWRMKSDGVTPGEVLKCAMCPTFFTNQEIAEEHLKKHCGVEGIKCDICTEAIQLWNEGRNSELGGLMKRYKGISDEGDGKETSAVNEMDGHDEGNGDGGINLQAGKGSTAVGLSNGEGKENLNGSELIKHTLKQVKQISNKNFFIVNCIECNEQFFQRHHLVNHYRAHEKFTCKECGKELTTMTEYQDHMESEHKTGIYTCVYCPGKFPSLGKLNFHMLGHLGLFQCVVCGMAFMSKQSLLHHVKSRAYEISHQPCPDDQRVKYSSSNPLVARGELKNSVAPLRRHGHAKVKEVQCKFCDRKFAFKHNLQRHMRFQHPQELEPWDGKGFICEHCGAVLANRLSLKTHLKRHLTPNIPCPKAGCKSMFVSTVELKAHLKRHVPNAQPPTGRFRCDVCTATFKTNQGLELHMKRHRGEEPHRCSFCGKTFMNITHMMYHMNRMHIGKLDHRCEVCGKAFADPSTLKVHRLIHSTDRPYKCEFCPKDFPTDLYLRAHRRVHTRPYKCSECGEGFANHSSRRTHMQKKHGIIVEPKRNNRYTVRRVETELQSERTPEVASLDVASMEDMKATEAMVISETNEEQREIISQILNTNFY